MFERSRSKDAQNYKNSSDKEIRAFISCEWKSNELTNETHFTSEARVAFIYGTPFVEYNDLKRVNLTFKEVIRFDAICSDSADLTFSDPENFKRVKDHIPGLFVSTKSEYLKRLAKLEPYAFDGIEKSYNFMLRSWFDGIINIVCNEPALEIEEESGYFNPQDFGGKEYAH